MSEQVLEGLKKMDPSNNNHWTMTGEPKLDTVKFLSGVPVTREELAVIAPGFNRSAMAKYVADAATETGNATISQPGPTGPGAGDGGFGEIVEPTAALEGPADREDEIETLAAQIARSDERILELKRLHEQAGKELDNEIRLHDALADQMIVVNPPPTLQQNIKAYLATVNGISQKRAQARHALANSGIDIGGLMAMAAPAPIDQALKGRERHARR